MVVAVAVAVVYMLVAVMCCSTDNPRGQHAGQLHLSLPFLGNLVSLHLGPCRMIFLSCLPAA